MSTVTQGFILKQISNFKIGLDELDRVTRDYFLWLNTTRPDTDSLDMQEGIARQDNALEIIENLATKWAGRTVYDVKNAFEQIAEVAKSARQDARAGGRG